MALETEVKNPNIKSMVKKQITLFMTPHLYQSNKFTEPMFYKFHMFPPSIYSGLFSSPDTIHSFIEAYVDINGDINNVVGLGLNVSSDMIRSQLGSLWYDDENGQVDLVSNIYNNGNYSLTLIHDNKPVNVGTPFIKYSTQPVENNYSSLFLDHLKIEKSSVDFENISDQLLRVREVFKVYTGFKEDSDHGMYKLERLFKFAKDLAIMGESKGVDLVAEINVIPPAQSSANQTQPVAYVKNEIIYNDGLDRKQINSKIKGFTFPSELQDLSKDCLLPNYNCHALYQNNFNSTNLDSQDEITKYKNYLKDFITFKNPDFSLSNLEQGKISLYLEQYLASLDKTPEDLNNHLIKSTNIVIMQSMLDYMSQFVGANTFYFPVASKFEMLLPITDDKIYSQQIPDQVLRRRSLIEALDRWDLDYVVLKAIVENVGYNPAKVTQLFKNGYESNSKTGKPLFSSTNKIQTFPPIGYSENDNTGPSKTYTNINSFPFFHLLQADDQFGTDKSFISWFYSVIEGDSYFYGDNIYDEVDNGVIEPRFTNHIYLDVPGSEDPNPGQEFIKRISAEDTDIAYLELLGFSQNQDFSNAASGGLLELARPRIFGGKTRSYSEILNGEKASSEIVYWRIEKKDKTGKLVQNFFMPNAPEFNPKVFVDSQLADDKQYEYTVYAWHVIYGTSYSYSLRNDGLEQELKNSPYNTNVGEFLQNTSIQDPFSREIVDIGEGDRGSVHSFEINVDSAPYMEMVEIPYSSLGGLAKPRTNTVKTETAVITSIPSPPNVEIIPYENTNNTLLFLLNSAAGTIEKDFMIGINPEDDEKLYSIYEKLINNNIASMTNDMKIEFNTTSVDRFEIYRLEEKPKSYKDFTNGKLIGADGILGIKSPEVYGVDEEGNEITISSSTLSYKDTSIVPNKKYYYTFRVIDKDGNFSNPTAVYEIEIVDDNGTIYPIIDTIDFDYENNLQSMKSVRKYLHIIPTLEQSLLDLDTKEPDYDNQTAGSYISANDNKNLKLGIGELKHKIFKDKDNEAVDGKKEYFKVRMTSKKTGKKVDINVKFKVKHNETKEQKNSLE